MQLLPLPHPPNQQSVFTDLEVMSALFSAAVHDVDHGKWSFSFSFESFAIL